MNFRLAMFITALFLSPLAFAHDPQERTNPFGTAISEDGKSVYVKDVHTLLNRALESWCNFLGITSSVMTSSFHDGYTIEGIEHNAMVVDLIHKHCSWLLLVE